MNPHDQDNHDQFLRFYIESEEALLGFVRSLVPTREDAREVMQQTAAVLWRKFKELDEPGNFRRWAFGVARFEALAFRRDKARDRHVFSEELMSMLEREAEESDLIAEQESQALQECLGKLLPGQRELVEIAYSPGRRIDELAMELGRTPMAVYKSLHRIRMLLAECIRRTMAQQEEGWA